MTPPASTSDAAPVKPRMILRLGVVGNQYFGTDNGAARGKDWAVNEKPKPMKDEVAARCREVFEEVLRCMDDIYADDQGREYPASQASFLQKLFGWTSFVFGTWRLWNVKEPGNDASAYSKHAPRLEVLTGLGDGVDEIAADIASSLECEVLRVSHQAENGPELALDVGALPEKIRPGDGVLPREQARVFAGIESERKEVLRAQAVALRHHGDVLMAVWDPDANAKEAGTVESVLAALSENIPVIAVRLGSSETGTRTSIQVLKHVRDLHATPVQKWQEGLREVLKPILDFPWKEQESKAQHDDHASAPSDYHALSAYQRFLSTKKIPRPYPGFIWQRPRFTKATSGQESEVSLPTPELSAAMKRAQVMSQAFGAAHRGGILLSYSLAALAVLFALIGHFCHEYKHVVACCCVLEAVFVAVMALLSFQSKKENWHYAYTDARLLAEALRMMEFLWPLGLHTPLPKLPHHLKEHPHLRLPRQPWSIWYFRALTRMLPLQGGPVSPAKNSIEMARHLSEDWIAVQIGHHERNSALHGNIHHRAEKLVIWFFRLAVGAVILHLVHVLHATSVTHVMKSFLTLIGVSLTWKDVDPWLFFFCVFMPAAIAAVHGAASQLESNRLSLRSKSLMQMLMSSKERLDALRGRKSLVLTEVTVSEVLVSEVAASEVVVSEVTVSESSGSELTPADYRFLQAEALNAASLMIDETAGWSLLYKNAAIPAG